MDDKTLYLDATQEVDGDKQDPALWAKAMALTEGNEKKAKYRYITLRIEEWGKKKDLKAIRPTVSHKTTTTNPTRDPVQPLPKVSSPSKT